MNLPGEGCYRRPGRFGRQVRQHHPPSNAEFICEKIDPLDELRRLGGTCAKRAFSPTRPAASIRRFRCTPIGRVRTELHGLFQLPRPLARSPREVALAACARSRGSMNGRSAMSAARKRRARRNGAAGMAREHPARSESALRL